MLDQGAEMASVGRYVLPLGGSPDSPLQVNERHQESLAGAF